MKKLLVLVAFVVSLTANASHLLGGHIQAIQQGLSDTVDITVTLFSDPQGIGLPQTLILNEYKVTVSAGVYVSNGTVSASQSTSYSWQGNTVTVYTSTIIRTAGNYRWVYSNCCRGILSNAPSAGNSNFTMALDYRKTGVGIPNSAPILFNQLPQSWVVNDTAQAIILAFDPDGDSVIVEMDDALNQYANMVFVPLSPFSQLNSYGYYSVDLNGMITWAPSTLGKFGTGYKVSEYRNGNLIGVNRIQQVYSVIAGSTPSIPSPFVQVNHDLIDGDSTEIYIMSNNATTTELFIPNVDVTKTSDSTWTLSNLQLGTYKAVSRVSNSSSNMDYLFTLTVLSTINIEENIIHSDVGYKVYDWNGRYLGNTLDNQKGFLILLYDDGKTQKIFQL